MAEFVSWLEAPCEADEKNLFGTSHKDSGILFLTDYMMWHTKEGKKTLEYDASLNQESSANGHGAIKKFFELSERGFERCMRRECQDFSTPNNFPKQVVDAIKELKLVRMSRGNSNWEYLLRLLNDESQQAINKDYDKWRANRNGNNYSEPNYDPAEIPNLKFRRFVSKRLKNEVIEKLVRIRVNLEAHIGKSHGGSDSFLQFFNWSETKEGKAYWWNINRMRIFEPLPELETADMVDMSNRHYWHDRVWESFKNPENRNPLWR
jgi:hypothetical protein